MSTTRNRVSRRPLSRLALPALAAALTLGGYHSATQAALMSCDSSGSGYTRTWTFDSAEACGTGPGNPNSSSDLEALGGDFDLTAPDTWTKQGDVTDSGDNSDWLNVTLTSGTWGEKDIEATWTLAPGFWDTFSLGVFTVHVGGSPQSDPDDFGAFIVTSGAYSGTWTFLQEPGQGGGGGLSNAAIWTARTPGTTTTEVPEPGVLSLFALGLLGAAWRLRRSRR